MLISMVGPKEPSNHFKTKVAECFKCPIFSFKEYSDKIFDSMSGLMGLYQFSTSKIKEELKILMRENLSNLNSAMYMQWMSDKLVNDLFRKQDNSSKKLQGIILDVETHWEYRSLRTFMLNPKLGKHNKFILIENDELLHRYWNKDYTTYNDWEVDAVISTEDFELEKIVRDLLRKWHL